MKLKAEIKPIEHYTIEIKGITIGTFAKKSAWEGMIKLVEINGEGILIIGEDKDIFARIFSDIFKPEGGDYNVIKATPGLIPPECFEHTSYVTPAPAHTPAPGPAHAPAPAPAPGHS